MSNKNNSAFGCSLEEAFGESWNAGPTYYQTSPERFRVADPYSSNVFATKETFQETFQENASENFSQNNFSQNRFDRLEAKVAELSSTSSRSRPIKNETFFMNGVLNEPGVIEKIDNVVKFALTAILASNFIEMCLDS
tara:strand:+ start:294 stop:707 length:414 start_codon:yes stop_codon:yes gene_type:complete